MLNITVLGAGAWGIGLSLSVLQAGHRITVWSLYDDEIDYIYQFRHHPKVLPEISIPKDIHFTSTLKHLEKSNVILSVVPTQAMRAVMKQLGPFIKPDAIILSCSKGIETSTGSFPTEIIKSELPCHSSERIGVLTGPNFAHEVASGLPAEAVIALSDLTVAKKLANDLTHKRFKFIPDRDVRGFELAGAFKNVLAIGSGLIMGYQLGENARAAYLTRGLNELKLLGSKYNCDPETFNSVGSLGDIILTCLSTASRNVRSGQEIAKRGTQSLSHDAPLAEGIHTVKAIKLICENLQIKLPTINFVEQIVINHQSIDRAYQNFLEANID